MALTKGIFDSHAHYDDVAFDDVRDVLLPSMPEANIAKILNVASDLQSAQTGVELARNYRFIYNAVGVHPSCVHDLPADYLQTLTQLCSWDKTVAIGEIGLDYYYGKEDKQKQQQVFHEQLQLASTLQLPVIIHSRDAMEDTLQIVSNFSKVTGVLHCFSGSVQTAMQWIGRGYYIGFTGVVTFKNARKAVEAAKQVPIDRLLVETDCPYMAPEPYRGKRCDSRMLHATIEKIADIKQISTEQVIQQTYQNACELFSIQM